MKADQTEKNKASSETLRVVSCSYYYYFAGLIDGDGLLSISKRNLLSLEITLHENDADLLYSIKETFGYGNVQKRPGVSAFTKSCS